LWCWFFCFSHDQTVDVQSQTFCMKHLCVVFSLIFYSNYPIIMHTANSEFPLSFWNIFVSPTNYMNRLCDWSIITMKHNKWTSHCFSKPITGHDYFSLHTVTSCFIWENILLISYYCDIIICLYRDGHGLIADIWKDYVAVFFISYHFLHDYMLR
jgi:hypothetical protein